MLCAGCSGASPDLGALSQTGAVGYQAANAFMPNGYSESDTGPGQVRIRATGNIGNSRDQLEKLAIVRAADLAKSKNIKYFRVDAVSEGIICGEKKWISGKEQREIVVSPRRTVDVDVTFAKEATDATWQNSKDVFDARRAELDAPMPTPTAPDVVRGEVAQKCGA